MRSWLVPLALTLTVGCTRSPELPPEYPPLDPPPAAPAATPEADPADSADPAEPAVPQEAAPMVELNAPDAGSAEVEPKSETP